MRKTCLSCTLKHLSQAMILIMESIKEPEKYDWHRYIACGHMAEAEDECLVDYPYISQEIRQKRILVELNEYEKATLAAWFEDFIKKISVLIDD